jgi:amino acid transporter
VSTSDLILGTVYVTALVLSFSYVVRSRYRRYRTRPDSRNRRELMEYIPLWLVTLTWAASLIASAFLDITVWGETVRVIVGWVTIAGWATAGGLNAFNERLRNNNEPQRRVKA